MDLRLVNHVGMVLPGDSKARFVRYFDNSDSLTYTELHRGGTSVYICPHDRGSADELLWVLRAMVARTPDGYLYETAARTTPKSKTSPRIPNRGVVVDLIELASVANIEHIPALLDSGDVEPIVEHHLWPVSGRAEPRRRASGVETSTPSVSTVESWEPVVHYPYRAFWIGH